MTLTGTNKHLRGGVPALVVGPFKQICLFLVVGPLRGGGELKPTEPLTLEIHFFTSEEIKDSALGGGGTLILWVRPI